MVHREVAGGAGRKGRLQRALGGEDEIAGVAARRPAGVSLRRRAGGRGERSPPLSPRPVTRRCRAGALDRVRQLQRGIQTVSRNEAEDFLQATAISAFSLVEVARAFKPHLARNASVVTIGISSLQVTPDNYGYMGPIKAALESSVPLPGEIVQLRQRGAVQRRWGGAAQDQRVGRHPGLYRELPLRREADLPEAQPGHTGGGERRPVSAQRTQQRPQRHDTDVDAGLGSNFFDKDIIRLAMRPEQ
jgi:hypothetical protein